MSAPLLRAAAGGGGQAPVQAQAERGPHSKVEGYKAEQSSGGGPAFDHLSPGQALELGSRAPQRALLRRCRTRVSVARWCRGFGERKRDSSCRRVPVTESQRVDTAMMFDGQGHTTLIGQFNVSLACLSGNCSSQKPQNGPKSVLFTACGSVVGRNWLK